MYSIHVYLSEVIQQTRVHLYSFIFFFVSFEIKTKSRAHGSLTIGN